MSRLSWRDRLRRMNQRSLFGPGASLGPATVNELATEPEDVSAMGSARVEAVQRLQVGLFGIGAMVLLVGLASIIGGQAERNDQLAVPEAAPTTEPSAPPAQANPLADAGVVPDIAAQPSPSPAPPPLDLPPPRPAAPVDAPPSQ
ncbi:MAG: hypothetical protein EAY70_04150 [Sphingomonadales bacterium]|nr:MAG: hypothetical protein EAY70_04150 [Sphingomonadales bacterium]